MSLTSQFGIDVPLFAFSHCRDVVAEVSRAGGFGVLGAVRMSPEQLDQELRWIDDHVKGAPYGIDIIIPEKSEDAAVTESDPAERFKRYAEMIPTGHREWVEQTLERLGVPPATGDQHLVLSTYSRQVAEQQVEVGLDHGVSLIVNALGTPPAAVIDRVHRAGVPIGALAGRVRHAERHAEAGLDLIIAQGCEAGGHVGDVTTMVLTPEVVDAVSPVPVLSAGGIGSGRQMAAARALGASGVWTGSIWLTTAESDSVPEVQKRYLDASSHDTVVGYDQTGKSSRKLRTPWNDAWKDPSAPPTLPMPLQGVLAAETMARIQQAQRWDLLDAPVGQVIGRVQRKRSARQVVFDMMEEYVAVTERMPDDW